MQFQRFALGAFVSTVALTFTLLFAAPASAAPSLQAQPPAQGQTTKAANLRSGPGTTFAKVGSVPAGKTVAITGCNDDCSWYQLDTGAWIAAFLIKPAGAASVPASAAATATPAGSAADPDAATASPSVTSTAPISPTVEAAKGASAKSSGNLRAGPGTSYARVGGVTANQALEIVGQTAAGDWYQLAGGNWISSVLVSNPPVDLPVAEAPAAEAPAAAPAAASEPPAAPPAAPAAPSGGAVTWDEAMQEAMKLWQDRIDLNTTKTCGHFEYKLTDVRRRKALWLFDREYVAQGEWLMVFVEVKNISPGTSHFGQFGPRLVTLTQDGIMSRWTGDFKASWYAGWMFSHGGFYEDINPGNVLGLVEAYDLALEPDMILGFGLVDCDDDLLSLGVWSKVPPATK
jgi:uncharacterized protein YraI